MRSILPLSFAASCVAFFALNLAAQPAQPAAMGPSRSFIGETLSVNVDVVDVYFTVKQKSKFVENLTKDDFVLLENNHKQDIRYFSAESQAQLSLGVLIDTSDSESPMLPHEHEIARRFFDTVLIPGDEALVASFDSNVQLRQDFTGDHESLVRAIEQSEKNNSQPSGEIDPGKAPRSTRSTALYDAILGLANRRLAGRAGRKAMIIISDGQDMGSRITAKQAIEAAVKSNSICYVLLVGDPQYMSSTGYVGANKMKYLAEETGGRAIMLDKNLKNLEASLLDIAAELRHHYSIGYTPSDRRADGDYRRISIINHHGLKVHARRGYYFLPRPTQNPDGYALRSAN